jgi:hypothetical protein
MVMTTYQGEDIARAVLEHQTSASSPWAYRDLADDLHRWVDRFDTDFNLGLPTPILMIEGLPFNVLARYRLGRNGFGARTTITLNEGWIPIRPYSDTLATLIHELIHAYEEWRLGREKGGWYHTVGWREKMAEVGIKANKYGIHLEVLPRFTDYLERYGVMAALPPSIASADEPPRRRRQMPKWICACPSENPARAVKLYARCLDCKQLYRKVES